MENGRASIGGVITINTWALGISFTNSLSFGIHLSVLCFNIWFQVFKKRYAHKI